MELPERKRQRLGGYDYSQNGCYFVTFCTRNRKNLLSTVGKGLALSAPGIVLSEIGQILNSEIESIPFRFSCTVVEKYVIMPNHVHLLLSIHDTAGASPRPTVSQIIGACKSMTTRLANIADHQPGRKIFQSSFYDEIIRNDTHFLNIWQYIDSNPAVWQEDEYYSDETEVSL